MRENNITQAWKLYEEGREYNNRLVPNQYNVVNTNTEFFIGNQWINLPETPAMRGLPKPTFNILKRVASLFIASLTSSGVALRFEPLAYYDGSNVTDPDHDAALFANAEVNNLLEKFKMDYRLRHALFDVYKQAVLLQSFYRYGCFSALGVRNAERSQMERTCSAVPRILWPSGEPLKMMFSNSS